MKGLITKTLFPREPRYFRGERWLDIVLRSAHLVGIAGIAGGFLLDAAPAAWEPYWYLALASGVALSALYLWRSFAWLFELKGLAVIAKIVLLWLALVLPGLRAELFVLLIVLSAVIAHAPAPVRGARWARPAFLPAAKRHPPRHRR